MLVRNGTGGKRVNKIKRARKISVVIVLSLLVGMMFPHGTTFADEGLKFSHRDEFNSFDNTFLDCRRQIWPPRPRYDECF